MMRTSRLVLAADVAGTGVAATLPALVYLLCFRRWCLTWGARDDWIENLLGLNMHSADQILPRFQQLAVGDELPMEPGSLVMEREMLLGIKRRAERT